jgi:transcriptional regulator with XRE-family HTH domain
MHAAASGFGVEAGGRGSRGATIRRPKNPLAVLLGENLARARKRAGLSQEELGVRASLHRTEISLLERGTRLPRIDTIIKLAGALEIPLDELIEGIGWSPGSTVAGAFSVPERSADLRFSSGAGT